MGRATKKREGAGGARPSRPAAEVPRLIDGADLFRHLILYAGALALPRLRALGAEGLKAVLDEAGECSLREPLHLHPKADLGVPSWDPSRRLAGPEVLALIVFGLWVRLGERKELAGALLDGWPEVEAAARLAALREGTAAGAASEREARAILFLETLEAAAAGATGVAGTTPVSGPGS